MSMMNTKMPAANRKRDRAAFTLIELLVTIAVIAILAGLLLSSIFAAKGKAHHATCLNNLRNLSGAFLMYLDDNEDHFPAPGSNRYGARKEDWIHWQQGREPSESSIVPWLGGYREESFVCPVEKPSERLTTWREITGGPYRFSYSFTSHDLIGEVNPGMSTLITATNKAYFFRSSAIRDPSLKIMLVDEDRQTLDDSRWVPVADQYDNNLIARRHRGQGNVAFADGHIERAAAKIGQDPKHSMPTY